MHLTLWICFATFIYLDSKNKLPTFVASKKLNPLFIALAKPQINNELLF